jgi:arylsulfatase A-like enzyme
MLKAMGTMSAAGLMGLSIPGISSAAMTKTPNIIFILSDDHRWDHMGFANHPFLETPGMDRLAREGVSFENAFVTTSLCSPSRASFLTGTYAHTHGVKNNLTPWTGDQTTVLEYLKGAGYDVGFIGKWHMPGAGLPDLDFLDRFVSFTIQEGQGRYFDCPMIVDGVPTPSRKEYVTDELTDYAIEFIEKERDNPFCLYLCHKSVHHAFLPPKDLSGIYDGVDIKMPDDYDAWLSITNGHLYSGLMGLIPEHYRNYCEAIIGLDREIERLLSKVDELGLFDNTIVIYSSDNGFLWGEHRTVDKNWPYEESIRIPFIVRSPWLVGDPGRRSSQMALNIDLAPTLLDIAGVPIPEGIEGESLVPILRSGLASGREAWMYEYFKDYPYNIPTTHGVRTDTHKLIEYEGRRKSLLFDLANDPKETKNLFGTPEGDKLYPDLKAMLEELKEGKRF